MLDLKEKGKFEKKSLLESSAPLLCEDDLTVYHLSEVIFLKILVNRVNHFLVAWLLECSAPVYK